MKLEAYLSLKNISVDDFAKQVNVARQTVYAYMHGRKLPRKYVMQRIFHATGGLVSANDFFEIEPIASDEMVNLSII